MVGSSLGLDLYMSFPVPNPKCPECDLVLDTDEKTNEKYHATNCYFCQKCRRKFYIFKIPQVDMPSRKSLVLMECPHCEQELPVEKSYLVCSPCRYIRAK